VVGETRSYSYDKIERAVNLVRNGAKLIGTNPDFTDSMGKRIAPSTGSLMHRLSWSRDSKRISWANRTRS
jgi:NagD protein